MLYNILLAFLTNKNNFVNLKKFGKNNRTDDGFYTEGLPICKPNSE